MYTSSIGFRSKAKTLYGVLVDGTTVVHIEIPRDAQGAEVAFEKWSVEEYSETRKKRLTKLRAP